MGKSLLRQKEAGQSIVLIAFMIAILVGMVGLSVDVGNAYAEQRAAQRAANSAALKGVASLISGKVDKTIYDEMITTLKANGVNVVGKTETPGPGQIAFKANYYTSEGVFAGAVGSFANTRPANSEKIDYIKVDLTGSTQTYLARVFGQETLAVEVETYGNRAPCTSGIFPLAVDSRAFGLTVNDVNTQGGEGADDGYSDGYYIEKPWRRLYLQDDQRAEKPGLEFAWLRWGTDAASGSPTALKSAFAANGNLEGFTEAPWQDGTPAGPKIDSYPIKPGYFNSGDWTYGGTGDINQMKAELDWHLNGRTELNLPIYDTKTSKGLNGFYHISNIGRFLLKEYGTDSDGRLYVEVVEVGDNKGCPAITSAPPPPTELSIVGSVELKPIYSDRPTTNGPVDIVMLLDETYSMRWQWKGNGFPVDASNPSRLNEQKRKAKDLVDAVIGPDDRVAIVGFEGRYPGDIMPYPSTKGLDQYSQSTIDQAMTDWTTVHANYTNGTTAGKTAIKAAIDATYSGGNTPTALGMEQAYRLLKTARTTAIVNGVSQPVQRVLVFITDGVANVYMDGRFSKCADGGNVSELCVPQLASLNQPINQVVQVADKMKRDMKNLQIFVVAMGFQFDTTGMNKVSSGPDAPFFNRADEVIDMNGIFNQIKAQIESGTCTQKDEGWIAPINSGRLSASGVIGTVKLWQGGTVKATAILEEDEAGRASYRFTGVQPGGDYTISGVVSYADKNTGAVRDYALVSTEIAGQNIGEKVPLAIPESFIGSIWENPNTIRFQTDVDACAAN